MEGEVVICRSLGDSKFDTISVWCITGIHWSTAIGFPLQRKRLNWT